MGVGCDANVETFKPKLWKSSKFPAKELSRQNQPNSLFSQVIICEIVGDANAETIWAKLALHARIREPHLNCPQIDLDLGVQNI